MVRQLLAEQYPVMNATELLSFQSAIKGVADTCSRAALVGGAALRVRLELEGLPVPKPISGDIDLVVNNYGLPEAGIHRYRDSVLDVFNTWTSFEPPFFDKVDYLGASLILASPDHLLAKKIELGDDNAKDDLYVEILSPMVSANSLRRYIEGLRSQVPAYIELNEGALNRLSNIAGQLTT